METYIIHCWGANNLLVAEMIKFGKMCTIFT